MRKFTDDDIRANMIFNSTVTASGCREWNRGRCPKGYGIIKFRGKDVRGHRVSHMLTHGTIDGGVHVLHSCDNRACLNPAHLFLGDNRMNIDDKCAKDRSGRKLNIQKVIEIRALVRSGESHSTVARLYGVNPSNISRAVNGARWGHVAPGGV